MAVQLNSKRELISKASATIVSSVGIASFVTMFCLISIKVLIDQRSYQSRVITAKSEALDKLNENIEAVKTLETQYKVFADTSITSNILGGNPKGDGDLDGDNARIVLDALPSKYDFPALASSLEKIINKGGYKIDALTGTDDEVTQAKKKQESQPKPVNMPFKVAISGNYKSITKFVDVLEYSIRPFEVISLSLSGEDGELRLGVSAQSYYQPGKTLNITTKEVK